MARKFRFDQSFTLDIANRDGRTLDVELWKDGSFSKTLITATDQDTVTLHTTQNSSDPNHIPVGTGYKIRVINFEDSTDYDVLDFTFDMVSDNEQNVPAMPWPGDDGWDFSFSGKSFVESSDAVGSTVSDLYSNDAVNGVVGRLEGKRPDNNASIPEYLLYQDTSADKPRLELDANGFLNAACPTGTHNLKMDVATEIANPGLIHLIFVGEVYFNSIGSTSEILGGIIRGYEHTTDGFEINGSLIQCSGINDGSPHVFEIALSTVAGDSWVRVDNGAKVTGGNAVASIPAGILNVLQAKPGPGEGPSRLYSFGMRIGEVVGQDYTNWYNYHADHAGLANI